MKVVKFLAWTFFVFCSHAVLSMPLHRVASKPQHEDFDKPKPIMQGQVDGLEGKMDLSGEGERRGYRGKHEIFRSIKGQRGKGAYGGANVVHRPRHGGESDALLSATASSFVTATMLCVSLALILVAPFLSL
ncbi:hypothetical protein SADUNF_Sadunf01G0032000 [Salix dunnii]|uniref:Glycine-rich protein n=1 Tax=Salix dunnii TaxID=1413687 RepID=A0A835TIY4_9ROSI|nr:hypothetical protein SADUNF_Sadunf01G0032000 [Salix dunnii]